MPLSMHHHLVLSVLVTTSLKIAMHEKYLATLISHSVRSCIYDDLRLLI